MKGRYDDLIDGKYEKTVHVKTWNGKRIIAKVSSQRTVDSMKKQIEEKTKTPKDHQQLVSRGRVLMDKKNLKEYNMNGKETIEMTALLIGGTKNKGLSPASKKEERNTKRKASEPYIDVSCLEEDRSTSAASEEEMGKMMQWMRITMKEIKDRTIIQN